jgi:mono/diheme cytochrome c family protein
MKALAALAMLIAGPALAADSGQAIFQSNCQACHQANGQGIKGAFPALAGDRFVTGAPAPVIAVVLNGRGGMPRFQSELSDAEIAAVITYVRHSWGNAAGAVRPPSVAAARSKGAPESAGGAPSH